MAASSSHVPLASKYGDFERAAIHDMSRSPDIDVRIAVEQMRSGKRITGSALKAVKRRLSNINSGTTEAAELRQAVKNLDAMLYVEKSSQIGEFQVAEPVRGVNALHARLAHEMGAAGASSKSANDIAFVMAWAAAGRSVADLIRNYPGAFESFGVAIRPLPKRTVGQWLDRAVHLAKGGK